jgi:hypothetical protein
MGPDVTFELSARDVSALLACVHDLHAETDAARLPGHLLRTVARLVPCRLAAFTQVDPVLAEPTGWLHPPELWDAADLARRFQAHIREHPVVQHVQATRDGQARAISDFLTARQFHATGLYRDEFRPMRSRSRTAGTAWRSRGRSGRCWRRSPPPARR